MPYLLKISFIFFLSIKSVIANEFEGVVSFNYDYVVDGKLNPEKFYTIRFTGNDNRLVGKYVKMNNPSTFELNFFRSRNSTIVSGLQIDGSFQRTMAGEVVAKKIVGVWYSVGGLKGDFEILKAK